MFGKFMDNIKSILSLSAVMPVLTINKLDKVEYLFDALLEGGLKTVEITLRTPCALEVIEKISKEYPFFKIGAGTVLNDENLQ
jgi:2-dehydro-3-deoxyphosphogluconate aldolase/(4S)-4-hydroxy-2-oxoglutarate aldolase